MRGHLIFSALQPLFNFSTFMLIKWERLLISWILKAQWQTSYKTKVTQVLSSEKRVHRCFSQLWLLASRNGKNLFISQPFWCLSSIAGVLFHLGDHVLLWRVYAHTCWRFPESLYCCKSCCLSRFCLVYKYFAGFSIRCSNYLLYLFPSFTACWWLQGRMGKFLLMLFTF